MANLILLKCAHCNGEFKLDRKTRRRTIYKCESCGRELPVKRWHNAKPLENNISAS